MGAWLAAFQLGRMTEIKVVPQGGRPEEADEEEGLGGIAPLKQQSLAYADADQDKDDDGHVLAPVMPIRMESSQDIPNGSFARADPTIVGQTNIGGNPMPPETHARGRTKSRLSNPTSRRGSRIQ